MFKHTARTVLVGAAIALPTLSAPADVNPNAGMLRNPDVGPTHIVFRYANDLWLVPREGGAAVPLASPQGAESFPRFSDDGKTIAFMGNYDGNLDLYTIPLEGGVPFRVTHHPQAEILSGWTSDDRLIFSSNSLSGHGRIPQLYTVESTGGLPEKLPVPYGAAAAISADGEWLAYTPHNRDGRTWKRYRGGMASDVWLFNLNSLTSKKITDWDGTDTQPMWSGDKVYYLSDGGDAHRLNIWMYNTNSEKRTQITHYTDYDVKWPSIGPGENGQGEIVYENGSSLHLLNLRTRQSRAVDVTIPGDRPSIRTKSVDASRYIQNWGLSATGKRAVIQARGDIWTAPAGKGEPRNLTRTSGVAERAPAWSPDGRWIAYFSDATGEYELYIMQSDGKGETRQLTDDGGPFKTNINWSPDSRHIVFQDKTGSMFLMNVEDGALRNFDRDELVNDFASFSWSHDSRWLAYDKPEPSNLQKSIWIYDVENDSSQRVTSTMFYDTTPAFDRKGDYLYFRSQRSFNFTNGDLPTDTTYIYKGGQVLLAVPLREDMDYVWAPESDEESWDDDEDSDTEEAEDGDAEEDAEGDPAEEPAPDDGVSGDWSGVLEVPDMGPVEMTLSLTLNASGEVSATLSTPMFSGSGGGTYDASSGSLTVTISIDQGPVVTFEVTISGDSMTGTASADGGGVDVNFSRASTGVSGGDESDSGGSGGEARETVDIDFVGFEHRALQLPIPAGTFGRLAVNDKNQLIYARRSKGATGGGSGIMLFDITDDNPSEKEVVKGGGGFDISGDGKKLLVVRGSSATIQNASAGSSGKGVKTSGMTAFIDPHDEWEQMYTDTWRIFRDYFYVDNLHEVDWDAMRGRYSALLDDCVNREDLHYVIGELIGELNVGHAYRRGDGDMESSANVNVGLLGCDYERENGVYRISKIYEGAVWDSDARGPLSRPGVDVHEGDYLLAVNGRPLDTSADPWKAFIGLAGKVTTLTVSTKTALDEEARDVFVKPISNERNLRFRAMIERSRAYVDEMTDGRIGYIYVINTGGPGQNDMFRQFFGQVGKEGLIIDDRWNGGGFIPHRLIELLNRPRTHFWARRDGGDWAWPPDSHQGPKCMLTNGMAGSGGDMFPWYFKEAGLGKTVGMRTWGGLVGLSGNPNLIDGGSIQVPNFGFYENDGTWGVEGHGVDADIEVLDDPALMVHGGDPQLDAAIEHMLQEIETNGYKPPVTPDAPDRSGMGVREEDK